MNLSEEFIKRMKRELSEKEWQLFYESLSKKPKRGIRINLKKAKEAEKSGFSLSKWAEEWKLEPLFSEKEMSEYRKMAEEQEECGEERQKNNGEKKAERREYILDEAYLSEHEVEIGKDPYHEGGLYYIQDPSAMEVVFRMDIRPFDRCLDLCAAPGGKSLHIADCLDIHRGGLLLSNEFVGERARILSQNVERMGYANISVVNESPAHLAENFPAFFSRILVDAPCSGEGMFRKSEEAVSEWSPELVERCATRQKEILKEAFLMLREGGELAYSTCTFERSENEEIREWILEENPDYQFLGEKRLYFHNSKGEGQYYALFRKAGEDLPEGSVKIKYSVLKKNKSIFLYPSFLDLFKSLKIFRLGIRVFEEGRNGWEYSHGLSHALNLEELLPLVEKEKPEMKYTLLYAVKLKRKDKRVKEYFYGNEIPVDKAELLPLISKNKEEKSGLGILYCDGIALGFGYFRNGRLRNFYPKGLRFRN